MDYIVWHITESEAELRASLQHPELFASKVANLKPGSRRMLEVLAVRRALKELFYGVEQQIDYDEHGRPSLHSEEEGQRPPYISISHTADFVAVITSDHPVGIDIERRANRVSRVTSHFLKPDELARLLLLSKQDDALMSLFLHLSWSAKEAAFKVLGPEYYDLQHLTTISMISVETRLITLEVKGRSRPMNFHFDYQDEYVLVWVEDEN